MKYKLKYRIRDYLFKLLFPTIAMHEAHLINDCTSMALKIQDLESNIKESAFETITVADSNCKTTWWHYEGV